MGHGHVQSIQRAVSILETLAGEQRETGIVALSKQVHLPASTVHRLLTTLIYTGLVAQNPETGNYRIGIRAFEVGSAFLEQTHLRDVTRPSMRELGKSINETVNLALRHGNEAVYVDQVECDRTLKTFTRPGARVPLYCSGVGKVLLAGYPAAEIDTALAGVALSPRTPATITDVDSLRHQIDLVRTKGYALDDEEFEQGVRCVAAPIYNHGGETVAALSVSAPAFRLDGQRLDQLINETCQAANSISQQLGRM